MSCTTLMIKRGYRIKALGQKGLELVTEQKANKSTEYLQNPIGGQDGQPRVFV